MVARASSLNPHLQLVVPLITPKLAFIQINHARIHPYQAVTVAQTLHIIRPDPSPWPPKHNVDRRGSGLRLLHLLLPSLGQTEETYSYLLYLPSSSSSPH